MSKRKRTFYSNMMIDTLALRGWSVAFVTLRCGLCGWASPNPFLGVPNVNSLQQSRMNEKLSSSVCRINVKFRLRGICCRAKYLRSSSIYKGQFRRGLKTRRFQQALTTSGNLFVQRRIQLSSRRVPNCPVPSAA